eukprot:m.494173 g.494173  ORF g.494173 m.494173 type:complete len:102 (+) comp57288_c0_seq14:603-908(+)
MLREILHMLISVAEAGAYQAQTFLGQSYRLGSLGTQSDVEALRWFERAAFQGDDDAARAAALIYRTSAAHLPDAEVLADKYEDMAQQIENCRTRNRNGLSS